MLRLSITSILSLFIQKFKLTTEKKTKHEKHKTVLLTINNKINKKEC